LAQNGAFLVHGVDVRTTPFPSDLAITTQHIVIKKAAKGRIRRELNTLGINQGTLFPEIDRAAETIVARYAEGEAPEGQKVADRAHRSLLPRHGSAADLRLSPPDFGTFGSRRSPNRSRLTVSLAPCASSWITSPPMVAVAAFMGSLR
jgi:hypothetical protein